MQQNTKTTHLLIFTEKGLLMDIRKHHIFCITKNFVLN